jgi:Sel1 repeat
VRCSICGSENPETHRFCGSCGTALVTAPSRVTVPSAVPRSESAELPQPAGRESERVYSSARNESPAHDSPTISGPSFLGLNQAGPVNAPRRSELRSFDYLLDEEEEHKGGKGKYVLILMALLIAAGIGYLRWKNQTQGWFSTSKPPGAEQTTDDSNANPTAPSSVPSTPPVAQNQPAATATAQPAPGSNSATGSALPDTTPANAAPANGNASPAGASPDNPSPTPKSDSGPDSAADQPDSAKVAEENKPAPLHPAKAKPSPARPTETSNSVAEATRYIYGRGVTQDCDHGLRLLKPAANQSDPRAMIQMGALYSAGLCTPRDLPTAYRWFALALRKEPDNVAVQGDLQKLWGEMTQPERQLAIRLTH